MSALGGWHRDDNRSCHACGAAAGEGIHLYVSRRGPVLCNQCISDAAATACGENPASASSIKVSPRRTRSIVFQIASRAKTTPEQVWRYLAGDEEMDRAVSRRIGDACLEVDYEAHRKASSR